MCYLEISFNLVWYDHLNVLVYRTLLSEIHSVSGTVYLKLFNDSLFTRSLLENYLVPYCIDGHSILHWQCSVALFIYYMDAKYPTWITAETDHWTGASLKCDYWAVHCGTFQTQVYFALKQFPVLAPVLTLVCSQHITKRRPPFKGLDTGSGWPRGGTVQTLKFSWILNF